MGDVLPSRVPLLFWSCEGVGKGLHSPPPGKRSGPHWLSDTQRYLSSLWGDRCTGGEGPCAGPGGGPGEPPWFPLLPTARGLHRVEVRDPAPRLDLGALLIPLLRPTANGFFPDLLHSASLPLLTSGQNPCIWFSVTIILVMMTKTEVPLGGEEREKNVTVPLRGGAVAIPTLQMRKPRLRLRELAEVTWLRKGGGGGPTGLFQPPI